jgi:hypothetical protein
MLSCYHFISVTIDYTELLHIRVDHAYKRLATSGIVQEHLVLLQCGEMLASFADIERHRGFSV